MDRRTRCFLLNENCNKPDFAIARHGFCNGVQTRVPCRKIIFLEGGGTRSGIDIRESGATAPRTWRARERQMFEAKKQATSVAC